MRNKSHVGTDVTEEHNGIDFMSPRVTISVKTSTENIGKQTCSKMGSGVTTERLIAFIFLKNRKHCCDYLTGCYFV